MSDPFLIEEPALISVSGGRTSAYMLWRILQAWSKGRHPQMPGYLPPHVYAVYADTGQEHVETYKFIDRCAAEWGVPIHRVAMDKGNHATPFDALIARKRYLPNPRARFCTQYLKIEPLADFMRHRGHRQWLNVVGIRADEPRRIVNVRANSDDDAWDNALPLAEAGITKADVMAFWAASSFDLGIPPGDGNCIGCFMKGFAQLIAIEQRTPGSLRWNADKEREVGGTFRSDRPSYEKMIEFARDQGSLPFGNEDARQDCFCTGDS